MKIAFIVVKSLPLGGGIEKYTDELGSRLVARGHEVTVYSLRQYGTTDDKYRGMTVHAVPTVRRRSLEKLVGSLIATLRFCRSGRADIVHFHAFGPAMWCFFPRLLGHTVITQGHGLEWKRSKWGRFGRWFLKVAEIPSVRFAHALTAVSNVQVDYLRRTYGRESVYIPTGIAPPEIQAPDLIRQYGLAGNDYILFAARLVREKGAHFLIQAYNRLNPDKKLVISGDAQYEETYKKELRTLAANNPNIIFTGFVTGKLLQELFSNAYFFVLPSEVEGLPTVLLEAMSYRNCCLASDIPENLEALQGHGFTFRNMDAADLASKMAELLAQPDKVESVKDAAREYVLKNFDWDQIADRFEEFYRSVLQGRKKME